MAVVLFTNLKGGVAKTTNAVAVAECFAASGKPTLVIDADHQCTASEMLLSERRAFELDHKKRTLHDLLSAMLKPDFEPRRFEAFVTQQASNIAGGLEDLSVIPCSIRIDDFETNYAKGGHGFQTWNDYKKLFNAHRRQFRSWLRNNFAYVIVDCPPSLAIQVRYLLGISDTYIIPCQPNHLSIRGSRWLRDRIQSAGYKTDSLGTLWSMCRGNDRMHGEIIAKAAKGHAEYEGLPRAFETTIPLAASIAHASEQPDLQPASFRTKYGGEFAKRYESLCEEIIERLAERGQGTGPSGRVGMSAAATV